MNGYTHTYCEGIRTEQNETTDAYPLIGMNYCALPGIVLFQFTTMVVSLAVCVFVCVLAQKHETIPFIFCMIQFHHLINSMHLHTIYSRQTYCILSYFMNGCSIKILYKICICICGTHTY